MITDTTVKTFFARIQGLPGIPYIMSNAQTGDPLNSYAVALKKLSSVHTTKRTEEHHRKVAEIQYRAAFYLNKEERIVVPQANIEGVIRAGATRCKKGQAVKAFVIVLEDAILEYGGPNTIEKLYAGGKSDFVSRQLIPGKAGLVAVTRPQFLNWSLSFHVQIDTEDLDSDIVRESLEYAGRAKGMGSGRPRCGRFHVAQWEEVEV